MSSVEGTPPTAQGFLPALFDFTFTRFVTPMLVKLAYMLAVAVTVIAGLAWVMAAITVSLALGALALFLIPAGCVLYLAFVRMALEFMLSVVRMSQDVHERLPEPDLDREGVT